jgi:hypothetical protein
MKFASAAVIRRGAMSDHHLLSTRLFNCELINERDGKTTVPVEDGAR